MMPIDDQPPGKAKEIIMRKSIAVFVIIAATFFHYGCKKKLGEGEACKSHDECKEGLKCVNATCLDISGDHEECKWALQCLRRLAESRNVDIEDQRQTARWYERLRQLPLKRDCEVMASQFIPGGLKPYIWKPICGEPPIEGIVKATDKSNPFKVRDFKIDGAWVPPDDPFHDERTKGVPYKDQCKAWVEFEVTRRFQGRVVARFHREYACEKVQVVEDGKKVTKEQCRTKPYERTDSYYYLYLTEPGTIRRMNFYVETPPEVCRDRLGKDYKTGCYCKGLDEHNITLEGVDDEFLTPMDFKAAEEAKASKK